MLSVLAPERGMWHACCVNFGTLGTIKRSRGTSEHKKGDLRVQVWISIQLGWNWGAHFESFWPLSEQHMCFLLCVFTGHVFKIPGFPSGCLGLQNQAFDAGGVAKNNVSHMLRY